MIMDLKTVAAVIPCHPRTLRVRLANQRLARWAPPPLSRPSDDHPYRFEKATVDRWLQGRAALRERLGKPHLRWCEPVAHPPEAGEPQPSDLTGAASALDLRRRLDEAAGDRMSPEAIDRLVLSIVSGGSPHAKTPESQAALSA
jgi:hypothetical protein